MIKLQDVQKRFGNSSHSLQGHLIDSPIIWVPTHRLGLFGSLVIFRRS